METFGNKKIKKIKPLYFCEKCDYKCCYFAEWSRHISTRKHSVSHTWKQMETKKTKKTRKTRKTRKPRKTIIKKKIIKNISKEVIVTK